MTNPPKATPANQYRKKPIAIEAFQLTKEMRADNRDWPEWMNRAWNMNTGEHGSLYCKSAENLGPLYITTLEGIMQVNFGDWIIRGVAGELYPCKDEIFRMTYEAATPASPPVQPTLGKKIASRLNEYADALEGQPAQGGEWKDYQTALIAALRSPCWCYDSGDQQLCYVPADIAQRAADVIEQARAPLADERFPCEKERDQFLADRDRPRAELVAELERLRGEVEAAKRALRQSHHLCCNYHERVVGECNCVSVMKKDAAALATALQERDAAVKAREEMMVSRDYYGDRMHEANRQNVSLCDSVAKLEARLAAVEDLATYSESKCVCALLREFAFPKQTQPPTPERP